MLKILEKIMVIILCMGTLALMFFIISGLYDLVKANFELIEQNTKVLEAILNKLKS